MKSIAPSYLTHQLLIAMPHMDDPHFSQTLVYLVEHGPDGAMGLVVNRPNGITLTDILEQLRPDQPPQARYQELPAFAGGPVQTERGFVLHPAGMEFSATLKLGSLNLTSSQDALFAIADGQGPEQHLIALGYAGWETGQLESELLDNAWLTCPLSGSALLELLFQTPVEQRLDAAAAALGINLKLLSCQAGHA